MFKDLLGEKVTVIVSSHGDNILEYIGTLVEENENSIILRNTDLSYMLMNIQKGIFGSNMSKYQENIDTVVLNKKYIISCNK